MNTPPLLRFRSGDEVKGYTYTFIPLSDVKKIELSDDKMILFTGSLEGALLVNPNASTLKALSAYSIISAEPKPSIRARLKAACSAFRGKKTVHA